MMFSRWFQQRKPKARHSHRSARPRIEALEDRLLFAIRTWDGGGGNNNWTTAANWNNNTAPVAGDDLVFSGSNKPTSNNDFAAATTFRSITFNTTGFFFTGNSVFVSQEINANTGTNTITLPIVLSKTDTVIVAGFPVQVPVQGNPHVDVAAGATLAMSGVISGTGTISKDGLGKLIVTGNNSYTNSTTINAGTLSIGHGSALGPESFTDLLEGATLEVQSGILVNETLNTTTATFGVLGPTPATLRNSGGVNSWSGQINLSANLTLAANAASFLTVSGRIRDTEVNENVIAALLQKTGAGRVNLSGNNTYTAATEVQEGTLRLQSPTALGAVGLGTTVANNAAVEVDIAAAGVENFPLTINEPLTLNGPGIGNTGALRNVGFIGNTWAGPVTLATNSHIGVDSGGVLTLTGVVSGSGELIKVGPSNLVLAGAADNTYTGNTRVLEGTLLLSKPTSAIAIPAGATLFIGDGVGGADADVVRFTNSDQIGRLSTVSVEVNSSGRLDLNNQSDLILNLTMTGGNVTTGIGTLFFAGGSITSNANASSATISGKIHLAPTWTFQVAEGSAVDDLVIPAAITGSNFTDVTFTKTGQGRLVFAGANDYSNVTVVDQGILTVANNGALGDVAAGPLPAGTRVAAGATLELRSGVNIGTEPLVLSGTGFNALGALHSVSGTTAAAGKIDLASNATVRVDGTNVNVDKLTLGGEIAGVGGLTKTGTGNLVYSGTVANTYTGQTTVSEGRLTLGKSADIKAVPAALDIAGNALVRLTARNQIDDAAPVTIGTSGELNLNDFDETIGPLTLTAGRAVSGGAGQRLTLAGNVTVNASSTSSLIDLVSLGSASRTFTVADGAAAVDVTVNGITGVAGVDAIKAGAGTMEASGTAPGTTRVNAGTLLVPLGKVLGPVVVTSGGTLGGEGSAKSITSIGGRVSPGRSAPGSPVAFLTSQEVLRLDGNSTTIVDLNGTGPGSAGHDQLRVTGKVGLDNTKLGVKLGFNSAVGDQFVIIENFSTEAVDGTFADLPEGGTLDINGRLFQISYVGVSPVTGGVNPPNDVILTHIDTAPRFPNRQVTPLVREGEVVTVTGVPTDPDSLDQFFLEVSWGDGTPKEILERPTGAASLSATHRYTRDGTFSINLLWRDQHGLFNTSTETTTVLNNDFLVTAAGQGSAPLIRLYDPDTLAEIGSIMAFDERFLGGVRVALGDVNADGAEDIIAAAGATGGPHVRVFNGADESELMSFFAYDPLFSGGVFVAAGDVNGDGHADIITGAGASGGPHVRAFSGIDGSPLASFFAYNSGFLGGVSVAAGDTNGDGLADIITGAGAGGGPHVRVFSGRDFSELASFLAYDPLFTGGVFVATGDVNGDGRIDLITGAGNGGGPHVRAFNGRDFSELASFFSYAPEYSGGVFVGAVDRDGDGKVEVITGTASKSADVRLFNPLSTQLLDEFFAFDASEGGVTVGGVA